MIFISQPVLKSLFLTLSVCLYDLWDLDCFWGFLQTLFQMTVMLSGVAGETKVFAQKKWQVRREIIFWSFFFFVYLLHSNLNILIYVVALES